MWVYRTMVKALITELMDELHRHKYPTSCKSSRHKNTLAARGWRGLPRRQHIIAQREGKAESGTWASLLSCCKEKTFP